MCIGIMARSEDRDRDRKRRLNGMMKDLQMIDPSEILPYLTCLSQMRKEQVRARCKNDGAMIAAAELMEELPKREGWYDELVKALRAIEKNKLADKLEGPEKQSSPSEPSQNMASGPSFQSTQIQAGQQHTPSPPANDPQQRHPEPEASTTPGYPSRAEEKDVQRKGEAEKEVNNSEVDENAGQQPPLGASLPIPIQEMRQRTPASDPQARNTCSRGSAASSPSRDLQGHDESESDECNASSPLPEGRSAQMRRGVVGEAEELAENNMLPGNASPAMDAGAVAVSVRPREVSVRPREVSVRQRDDSAVGVSVGLRDDGSTGRETARGRMEDEKLKRREVGKGDEEWRNIPSESEQDKHPHILKTRNHPNTNVKQNNLSPAIDSRAFNRNSDQTAYFKAPYVGSIREEERQMTGTHSLSSSGVDPRDARAVSSISESDIFDGISTANTASQSGTCLQQNDKGTGNTESTGEVQGGADKSGTGERGAIGGVDASNDNQDSLIMRMGTVVRGYIPTVLNSLGEHILKPW